MGRREVIVVPGLEHGSGTRIPLAVKLGSCVHSAGISPVNPETRTAPESLDAQLTQVFANAGRIMSAAGGTLDDIVQITVRLKDYRDNAPLLNAHWYRVFPD